MAEFKKGEFVLYRNGDRCELGRVLSNRDPRTVFVCYSAGETAAATPVRCLSKLENLWDGCGPMDLGGARFADKEEG